MMRAIAIDDEPPALDIIEAYCSSTDLLQYEKGFSKTIAAAQYLDKNPVDLLFLDINMPNISGIDFYKSLPNKPMLIFTTSYSEYALESYELKAIDYLLKPFTLSRFNMAVSKAHEMYNLIHHAVAAPAAKYLAVKADYGLIKITLAEIVLIEGLDNYLKIYLKNQPPVVVRMTLKSLQEKLHANEFVRVHRSYIVPVSRIQSVKQRTVFMDGHQIPVGKNYEAELDRVFNQ